MLPLWQLQRVNNGTDQRLLYSIIGDEGSRSFAFTWIAAGQPDKYDYSETSTERYTYQVSYEEHTPGTWTLSWLSEMYLGPSRDRCQIRFIDKLRSDDSVTDSGVLATTGSQHYPNGDAIYHQWAWKAADTPSGTITRLQSNDPGADREILSMPG